MDQGTQPEGRGLPDLQASHWRERGLRDAVLAGDESAWREWYEEEYGPLEGYIRWRTGGLNDFAEDVLQETWLVAIKQIRRFDPKLGAFRYWLWGIAANVIRNQLRKRKRLTSTILTDAESKRDDSRVRERGERIAVALAQLPEHYEKVLRMKYLEGCSVAEIATTFGETNKAIESQLTRAREAFRMAYGDDHDG
jgi:RNA polymerase sigma-70 factor (ECF subfamily)